jgi:hypothetical protein
MARGNHGMTDVPIVGARHNGLTCGAKRILQVTS